MRMVRKVLLIGCMLVIGGTTPLMAQDSTLPPATQSQRAAPAASTGAPNQSFVKSSASVQQAKHHRWGHANRKMRHKAISSSATQHKPQ